jgi:BirA family transcriptional regulator, biotin operon repressor / biotin---[acetyl-CoA-carboxylase] ligase
VNRHERLMPDLVEPLLRGRFGRPYLWSAECASTQDVLRDPSLNEGAVAVTEHQTAGRGREGRAWEDVPGRALLLSVLLRPRDGLPVQQLSLVAGLAVAEAIDAVAGTSAELKWPNDVLLDGRKVAGVLLESTEGTVICGIGVNVAQPEAELPADVRVPAGSLQTATGRDHDRPTLLVELLARLQRRYEEWLDLGLALFLPDLERRDALRGVALQVGGVSGTAAGIAADGRLRIRGRDGTETLVASGEVEPAVSRRGPGRGRTRSAP